VTDLKFTALYPPVEGGASPPLLDHEFSFLPPSYTRTHVELLDSCNGLLLLRYRDDASSVLVARTGAHLRRLQPQHPRLRRATAAAAAGASLDT
jgi:hypothetical protein